MGTVKCCDCKNCEIIDLDNYDCKAQPPVTVTYYGAYIHERTCRHFERRDEDHEQIPSDK